MVLLNDVKVNMFMGLHAFERSNCLYLDYHQFYVGCNIYAITNLPIF